MLGCTSPTAKNYDPSATEDDGSCIWLDNIAGTCFEFTEVPAEETKDNSFTVSMAIDQESLKPQGWVYFHDYFPDAYVHTRNKLLNLKNNISFFHSAGPKGIYHYNTNPQPYFIDVLFSGQTALNLPASERYRQAMKPFPSLILNSVNWITEVRATANNAVDDNSRALFLETLTSITIWNQYQTSGKITLVQGMEGLTIDTTRNAEETWQFNTFRNILDNLTDQFILDLFQDFRLIDTALNYNLPWWEQRLIEGKYFIIRFEFDNNNNKQIILEDVDADISKSAR